MWNNQSAAAAVGAQDLEDAWGDANSFYALGKNGTLYQFNRGTSTWSAPDTLCAAAGTKFKDLWGDGAGNIYFASDNGVYLNNDTSCTLVAVSTEKLEGIYGSTTTGEIYAVGKKGVVMFFDGASWTETTEGTEDLKDAWVSSEGNAYYAGKNGQTSTCTFTVGTTCTTTIIPGESEFKGISGSSDTNVIAVGKSGEIQQFNGTTWKALTSPTPKTLEEVEVADAGTALRVGRRLCGRPNRSPWSGAIRWRRKMAKATACFAPAIQAPRSSPINPPRSSPPNRPSCITTSAWRCPRKKNTKRRFKASTACLPPTKR